MLRVGVVALDGPKVAGNAADKATAASTLDVSRATPPAVQPSL
jgi:hypothetical protein